MRFTPALFLLVLAALPSRASEARDYGTNCTSAQQTKIDKWVGAAKDWTALAKRRVGEGEATTKGQFAKRIGKDVFGPDYDAKKVAAKLEQISGVLASPDIRCVTKDFSEYYYCDDDGGKKATFEAFTDVKSHVIWLCPKFLAKTGEKNDIWATGRMVHEASHATGVGDPKFEAYCTAGFNCESSCGEVNDAYNTADNWAQFVHCASDHESNEEGMVITASPQKKR